MKLLLDEMWPPQTAAQLRTRGQDVVAVSERSDLRGMADTVVFGVAQLEGRAVVTENVADYRPIAAYEIQHGRTHAGLIFTANRRFPRHDRRTLGRLVRVLATLLSSGRDLMNLEHWLA